MSGASVIIAGAGPVGLSLALGLARRGVTVEVLEAEPWLSDEARASTLHAATLEMFADWGVVDEVLACGRKVDRLQYWERETRALVAEFHYALIADDTPYPFRLQCPQHVVTPILQAALEATGRGAVRFSHRVVGAGQSASGVTVSVETPDGLRELSADYLCGADGARSRVRDGLGLTLDGMTYEDRFLLVATDLDFSRWFPAIGPVGYVFDPSEWVILMRLPEVVRSVFRLRPDEDRAAVLEEASIRARIAAFLGEAPSYAIRSKAIYSVHQRVAQAFRVGRVLLLGDAAHVNNPAGGMGMNSGIHDAFYLVGALADVLGGGDPAALDVWAEARRAVAVEGVQRAAADNYARLVAESDGVRRARNSELAELAADPARARAYLLAASMLDARTHPAVAP